MADVELSLADRMRYSINVPGGVERRDGIQVRALRRRFHAEPAVGASDPATFVRLCTTASGRGRGRVRKGVRATQNCYGQGFRCAFPLRQPRAAARENQR